jgi:hypothetical protein
LVVGLRGLHQQLGGLAVDLLGADARVRVLAGAAAWA